MNNIIDEIKKEVHKVVVGQDKLINSLIIGLLTDGHILVEGIPGLAKTTTINSLSKSFGLDFNRIQFTPDLLPSDITGAEIYNQKEGNFKLIKGPIFTNLLLADEINRAPAKVQSALLEVMQEKQVTIGNETFKLEEPFLVLATQNPIEQEGAYKLPEAQLDRFMMNVIVDYNSIEEEFEIVKRIGNKLSQEITKVVDKKELLKLRKEVEEVFIDDVMVKYILNIVFATRDPEKYGLKEIAQYIEYGVSPRASIDLFKASKASAYLKGNDFVTPVNISEVLFEVLQHRLILTYNAEADNVSKIDIIKKILKHIPIP